MKKVIIMISGKKGVGKTTLSNRLTEVLREDYTVFETAFAKGVKEISNIVFEKMGVDISEYMVDKKEMLRPIYQSVGNLGRSITPSYWTDALAKNVKSVGADITIVDDVRFPNEIECFDDEEDYIVIKFKVDRESIYEGVDLDVSETALDNYNLKNFDLILGNCVINKIGDIVDLIQYNIIKRR